ncbi:general substrate transporter [Radiomyces spectabilis]|uniref:general substrate transporter n=1 Tax=Radiomyces spectabilis TaxID=64574 RepID=UPI00221F8859|nr:general substrate transporter [Radiomyces spectabilis]KAI8379205.1 general substrate transporter [Radiomyces spectabilis]
MDSKIRNEQDDFKDTEIEQYDQYPVPTFRKSVYLSAIVAAIGGFICGFDTGAVSGILVMDLFTGRFFTEDNITYLQGLLLALFLMTAALGSFSSGYLCDRFSRKYSIVFASGIFVVGILLEVIGANFGCLLAGRLIGGWGSGLMGNAIPLYHSEIAPPDIRGRLISFFTLMSTFGQVAGYFITFGTSYLRTDWQWRAPWLLQLLLSLIFGGIIMTLPFSPRWLIDKGRKEEAESILADLYELPVDHPIVRRDLREIISEIEFERSLGKRTYAELFQGTNLKRTLISFFISSSTSFTGTVAIWYYAPQIFQSAGLDDKSVSIAATGGSGLLSLLVTALSLQWFIDKVGRKAAFMVGSSLMGISMFIVGAMFSAYTQVDVETGEVSLTNTSARNTILAFVYIFTAAYAFSWGIACYVYPAEVFNMRTRAKGLALTYGLNWGFSILITYCVPLFMAHTVSGVYFFFGACCVVCFIGVCFIPETKGLTLEQMETLFGAQ